MTDIVPVVIAEKVLHKGAMYGQVSNGGGVIKFDQSTIGIKFTALDDKFVVVQLIQSGIGVPIKTQSWQKVKKERQVIIKEVERKPKEEQIKFEVSEEKEVLF